MGDGLFYFAVRRPSTNHEPSPTDTPFGSSLPPYWHWVYLITFGLKYLTKKSYKTNYFCQPLQLSQESSIPRRGIGFALPQYPTIPVSQSCLSHCSTNLLVGSLFGCSNHSSEGLPTYIIIAHDSKLSINAYPQLMLQSSTNPWPLGWAPRELASRLLALLGHGPTLVQLLLSMRSEHRKGQALRCHWPMGDQFGFGNGV